MKIRLVICSLLLGATVVLGSTIRLNSGQTYTGANVVSRNTSNLEIQVQYGVISLALNDVDSIDGVRRRAEPKLVTPRPVSRVATITSTGTPASVVSATYVHSYKMDMFLVTTA